MYNVIGRPAWLPAVKGGYFSFVLFYLHHLYVVVCVNLTASA